MNSIEMIIKEVRGKGYKVMVEGDKVLHAEAILTPLSIFRKGDNLMTIFLKICIGFFNFNQFNKLKITRSNQTGSESLDHPKLEEILLIFPF